MAADCQARSLAQLILDAFDVDLQIFAARLLHELRDSRSGDHLAEWAQRNPVAFRNLLRGISTVVQSRPQRDGLLQSAITAQLQILPSELHRLAADGGNMSPGIEDPDFQRRYEEAVECLSHEDLAKIARLSRQQLREWVYSPKKVRPYLLNELAPDERGEILPALRDWVREAKEKAERRERAYQEAKTRPAKPLGETIKEGLKNFFNPKRMR